MLGHAGLDQNADIEEAEAGFFAKYAAAPPPLVHRLPDISPDSIRKTFCLSSSAAQYAYNYYKKWANCRKAKYIPYEETLIRLFRTTA